MDSIKLLAEDAVIVNEKLYCICRDMSVLYSVDMRDNSIKLIGTMPNEKFFLKQSCRRIIRWNQKLILVPYYAKYIHIYDIDKEEWENIEYPNCNLNGCRYIEGFLYHGKVIMIGAFAPDIIELDLKNYAVTTINTYFGRFVGNKGLYCRSGYAVVDRKLYIALAVTNEVLKVDLESYEYETFEIGNAGTSFSGIAHDGDSFWLTSRKDGDVFVWKEGLQIRQVSMPFEIVSNGYNFGGVYYLNGNIYIHGFEGYYSAVIDKASLDIDYEKATYLFMRKDSENKIIMQNRAGEMFVCEDDSRQRYECRADWDEIGKCMQRVGDLVPFFGHGNTVSETKNFNLKGFIYLLKEDKDK